ncbi:LytR C-terminal domain-containing protein [Amnibacterium sp.]|uniref:LytR C-terminal domain-containing protein n=1 Tax=Amnibacterium sp. TaxID=1872496 RepID=UPI00262CE11B|nr:LytR C-terminal domain-containing protein [Amnibacterium sp.]
MATTPRDRFDDVPADLARVGAHRAPRPAGRGFVAFAWAALATGVLVGAGVLGLGAIEGRISNVGSVPTTPTAAAPTPTVDPNIDVVLLNATTANGLAAGAESMLVKAGWKVGSTANASATDVKATTVYYTTASQAGAAAGLAKSLGITRTALSQQFAVPGQSRLTVVLGADYAAAH